MNHLRVHHIFHIFNEMIFSDMPVGKHACLDCVSGPFS